MSGRRVPEDKREIFKQCLGSDLKESELVKHKDKKIITVGDVVSLTMRRNGIRPILSVYPRAPLLTSMPGTSIVG